MGSFGRDRSLPSGGVDGRIDAMASDRTEKIRARAHQIWEREGRPEGRHEQHWAQAAHEIDNEERAADEVSEGLKVTPYNDPSRPGGPIEGGPRPAGGRGVASGLQQGGASPGGGAASRPAGAIGTGGGSTAGRDTGSKAEGGR
jgi:hypothetical protein